MLYLPTSVSHPFLAKPPVWQRFSTGASRPVRQLNDLRSPSRFNMAKADQPPALRCSGHLDEAKSSTHLNPLLVDFVEHSVVAIFCTLLRLVRYEASHDRRDQSARYYDDVLNHGFPLLHAQRAESRPRAMRRALFPGRVHPLVGAHNRLSSTYFAPFGESTTDSVCLSCSTSLPLCRD